MTIKFGDMTAYCTQIVQGYAQRRTMYNDLEDMYLLTAGDLPDEAHIKETISPDARNSLIGAVRLLTATDPIWRVRGEANNDDADRVSSLMERAATRIWSTVSRIKRKPLHYSAALSALLYDELAISVLSTESMVALADKRQRARYERLAKETPLMFEVISPQIGYPVFSGMGLEAYYTCQTLTVRDVISRWGKAAGLDGRDLTEQVEYNEYWDSVDHGAWIGGESKPIILEEHKLPMIPIACGTVEGSYEFFTRTGQQSRQPFLYALWKSNLWKRQNLSLTLMYSMMYAYAANPVFVLHQAMEGQQVEPDFDNPGGTIVVPPGARYGPLERQVIDPSMLRGLEIADEKTVASTIYRQALGEPLGSSAPYSMVALLSQAGRLPLVPYQRMIGWVMADAMTTGMQILREQGGSAVIESAGGDVLKAKDIPEVVSLDCELQIAMPQDEAQNARIALELTGGENPLMSVEEARGRYLHIEQSDIEQRRIWAERFAMLQAQMAYAAKAREIQQQAQPNPNAIPGGAPVAGGRAPLSEPLPPRGMPGGE